MAGSPKKEVNLEEIVDDLVKRYVEDIGDKLDWEKAWPSLWEDAIDEVRVFGWLVKEDETPVYPPFLKKERKGIDSKIKEQLVVVLKERLYED